MNALEKLVVVMCAICTVVIFHATIIVWGNFRKKRQYEMRQRQKKIDHQNNIGRRIYNALDSDVRSYTNNCQNVTLEESTEAASVIRVCDFETSVKVCEVEVNMLGSSLETIRVQRERQSFDELWTNEEESLRVLIDSLVRHVRGHHYISRNI